MANLLSVLLCVVLSVVVSFVFAFGAWYTGVVSNLGLTFGLLWTGIYPLMFYVQATTAPAVKDGEPPRTAWLSHTAAMLIVIGFYLIAACGWSAYLYAKAYSMQPELISAAEKLSLRNKIAAAIEMSPNDTAFLVILRDQETAEGARVSLEALDQFMRLQNQRPPLVNRTAFREWMAKKRDFELYVHEVLRDLKPPTSAPSKPSEPGESVFDLSPIFPWGVTGTFHKLPWFLKFITAVVLLGMFSQLVVSVFEKKEHRMGRVRLAIKLAVIALMLIAGGGIYLNRNGAASRPQAKNTQRTTVRVVDQTEAAPAASPSTTPVRRVFTLDANLLGFNHRWVNTGIVLEPGQKMVMKIIGQPTLRNKGKDFCLPRGCRFQQYEGQLWHGDARHMALMVGIGDGKPYATEEIAMLDSDALGRSGEIKLSVNQVVKKAVGGFDADFEWTQMTGRVEIEFTTV
jgi:hypothetical protein